MKRRPYPRLIQHASIASPPKGFNEAGSLMLEQQLPASVSEDAQVGNVHSVLLRADIADDQPSRLLLVVRRIYFTEPDVLVRHGPCSQNEKVARSTKHV
jgi:hypothetical protein